MSSSALFTPSAWNSQKSARQSIGYRNHNRTDFWEYQAEERQSAQHSMKWKSSALFTPSAWNSQKSARRSYSRVNWVASWLFENCQVLSIWWNFKNVIRALSTPSAWNSQKSARNSIGCRRLLQICLLRIQAEGATQKKCWVVINDTASSTVFTLTTRNSHKSVRYSIDSIQWQYSWLLRIFTHAPSKVSRQRIGNLSKDSPLHN